MTSFLQQKFHFVCCCFQWQLPLFLFLSSFIDSFFIFPTSLLSKKRNIWMRTKNLWRMKLQLLAVTGERGREVPFWMFKDDDLISQYCSFPFWLISPLSPLSSFFLVSFFTRSLHHIQNNTWVKSIWWSWFFEWERKRKTEKEKEIERVVTHQVNTKKHISWLWFVSVPSQKVLKISVFWFEYIFIRLPSM